MLFTIPSRYLSAIGHQEVFRLTRWSWQIHTRFHEPRATRDMLPRRPQCFAYGGLTHYAGPSQALRLHHDFLTPRPGGSPVQNTPTTPTPQPLPGITRSWFSLIRFRSPLLTESLNCFLFLWVLRCFTSPRSLHAPYAFRYGSPRITRGGVSPFGDPRITARLSAPRGLSQITASFIGS